MRLTVLLFSNSLEFLAIPDAFVADFCHHVVSNALSLPLFFAGKQSTPEQNIRRRNALGQNGIDEMPHTQTNCPG